MLNNNAKKTIDKLQHIIDRFVKVNFYSAPKRITNEPHNIGEQRDGETLIFFNEILSDSINHEIRVFKTPTIEEPSVGFSEYTLVTTLPTKENECYVDRENNLIKFHSSQKNSKVSVTYYSIGVGMLSSALIYTNFDSNNKVIETLHSLTKRCQDELDRISTITSSEQLKIELRSYIESILELMRLYPNPKEVIDEVIELMKSVSTSKAELEASLLEAERFIEQIRLGSNKFIIINPTDWVRGEEGRYKYEHYHNLNTTNLNITTTQIINNVETSTVLDYEKSGNNKIIFYTMDNTITAKAVISATYFPGILGNTDIGVVSADNLEDGIEKVVMTIDDRNTLKSLKTDIVNKLNKSEHEQFKTTVDRNITNITSQISTLSSSLEEDKTKIGEISSSLEQKAQQVDLIVERERINNLAKLQQGSTTGDAELVDGRVGADGRVYNNLGSAIREQIKQKDNALSKLENDLILGVKQPQQVLSLNDFKTVSPANEKVVFYEDKINISNILSGTNFINNRSDFFVKGDILKFNFKFRINNFTSTADLSRMVFSLNRYDGNINEFGFDFYKSGEIYTYNTNSTLIQFDKTNIYLGDEINVTVTLNTKNAILDQVRIYLSLSNPSQFTNLSIDILDVSTFIVKDNDGEKITVKYSQEAETIANLEEKISYTLRTKDIQEIKNMENFHKLGFGMFIHWGVYSALEGRYSGLNVLGNTITYDDINSVTGSEWILRQARIPKDTYKAYQSQFNSNSWDTELIAKLAYNAGMKYIIITAKHHEGFSLYPSTNSEWNISTTNARVTVLDELKESCKKYGLKFGLYFSQNFDWTAEGGFGQEFTTVDNTDPYTMEQHRSYVSKTVLLINELIDRYNPDIFWYDIPNEDDTIMQPIKENQLIEYPNIFVNDRLSKSNIGDFATGEGAYYHGDREYAENCYTLNDSWGYSLSRDTVNKTITYPKLIKKYILESLARGQNSLINISPKKDGSLPQLQKDILSNVSNFCKKYGTFFNTKNVNKKCQPNWGRMLVKDNILKCYVYEGNTITINGINTNFVDKVRVYDIADEYSTNNYQIVSDSILKVNNIPTNSNGISVVDVYFSNNIISDDINYFNVNEEIKATAFNIYGGLSLNTDEVVSIGAWFGDSSIKTRFQFKGENGQYKINYKENMRPDTNYTFNFKLVNEKTKVEQNISVAGSVIDNTTTSTVTLEKDGIYELTVSKTGSWVNLVSCKFTN